MAGESSHELSHLILLLGEVWRLLGVDVAEHLGERRLGRGLGGVEGCHHVAPGGRARGLFAGVVPPALGGERLGAGVRTTLYHTHTHTRTHTRRVALTCLKRSTGSRAVLQWLISSAAR